MNNLHKEKEQRSFSGSMSRVQFRKWDLCHLWCFGSGSTVDLEFYLRSYLVDLPLFLMQVLCTCASEMHIQSWKWLDFCLRKQTRRKSGVEIRSTTAQVMGLSSSMHWFSGRPTLQRWKLCYFLVIAWPHRLLERRGPSIETARSCRDSCTTLMVAVDASSIWAPADAGN